ncbi:MAG: thermonuclease family protein [Candidatus Aminicenantes bacterium]|nr:thermonuclease family protein [Candidatus Aminicenantes bacterium]
MKTIHRVINGDSRRMIEIEDRSVDLMITSPPYWQLKDYGWENEIGFNNSYEEYINNLNLAWDEAYRVLDSGCRLCINIGDQYARSVYYGRYKIIPIRTEIIKFCETIGFDYMGAVIWQKVATTNTTGGATIMGSYPFPRNGILKLDYEFILIFKKVGKSPKKISREIKEQSRMTKEEWNTFFSGHWKFSGVRQDGHIAMFPLELPRRLIKMFSFVGDTVLDPFLGSGTTSLAALELNRNSVGYEINSEFLPVIKNKLGISERRLFNRPEYREIKQKLPAVDFKKEIAKLPYIFKDPVKLDKKIDPKKLQFGSKIDKNSGQREDYFSVKQVLSPGTLELNNGLRIKLLGIKEDHRRNGAAVYYLEEKLKGRKVFLKFDETKHDAENNLLCYLYLENKTFINAHLLKEGLALVDERVDFKYKERFIRYREQANG